MYPNHQVNKVNSIRVAKLLIQETGTYNQQYLRPYVTDTSIGGEALDNLARKMVGQTANPILSPLSVVGSSGGFITRSPTPDAPVNIVHGWDQRRIRFLMEVVVDYQIGASNSHFVMGYTDFTGVNAATGSIAPEMIFYINSIVKTRNIIHHVPGGPANNHQSVAVNNYNVVASQHLLYDNSYGGFNAGSYKRTMRPEDIYTTMGNAMLFADSDYINNGFDTRNTLRGAALTADRSLSTPANFITEVVNNYIHAAEAEQFGQDENSIIAQAKMRVMMDEGGKPSHDDPFLTALSNMRGGLPVTGSFTFQELMRLDPNAFNVTNYAIMGGTEVNGLHRSGQTQHWGGSDRLTAAAAMLSNSVPALMMDLMITRLAFKSTNHDITGRMRTDILAGKGFSNLDMTMNYERFKDLFERLVVTDLTYGNMIGYAIEMNVDLLGETWIKISLDNEPLTDFVTPSFCDAMYAPVITTNQASITNLTQDFSNLIGSVQGIVKENNKPLVTSFV